MTTDPQPEQLERNELLDLTRILYKRSAWWRGVALTLIIAVTVNFGLYIFLVRATSGPQERIEQRLEELAQFNRDFIRATCDSSLYSADELARRTVTSRRRLALVCASRKGMNATIAEIQGDTVAVRDTAARPDTGK